MKSTPLKIAVGVSGEGRSLRNLILHQKDRAYEVAAVIASRKDCGAVKLAEKANLPVLVHSFPPELDPTQQQYIEDWLLGLNIKIIALAGFLKQFPILRAFSDSIINIHPALLPSYGGKGMYGSKVHEAVYAAKEATSGATVHFVSPEYDKGRIIAQVRVPLLDLPDPKLIAERVFAAECKLYPEVIHRLALGSLPLAGINYPIFEEINL